MMKFATIIFLSLIFLLAANTFAAQDSPRRIVSLGPFLTEEIYLLGAEERLVGVTTYCVKPPQAKTKEKIGTVTEVSLEKVIALKPDIVLATPLTDIKAIDKLKKLGIKVLKFPQVKNFDEICREFKKLGNIVGCEEKADKIIAPAAKRIETVVSGIKNRERPKVFIQVGANPLFTMNRDYFVNDLIRLAGADNIAANARSGIFSREKVIEADPDVIIISTMGIVAEDEKSTWQRYRSLKAVKNNRIYVIDSYKICDPTPVSFADALEEINGFLCGKGNSE